MSMNAPNSRAATGAEAGHAVGDVLIAFGADKEQPLRRLAGARSGTCLTSGNWTLHLDGVGGSWKGFPCREMARGSWRFWMLGEQYGQRFEESLRSATSLPTEPGAEASWNGHFLLLGWDAVRREWHAWSDRFGTVHAYYVSNGQRAALGTFSPAVAGFASGRRLDWMGLAGFFAFGFFPEDRTFFEDVRILRPASHYVFDVSGSLVRHERYWEWAHHPDPCRSFADTVAQFGEILERALHEQTEEGRVAVPISGGLDSRTTVAVLTRPGLPSADGRLWSYSYGYTENSVETRIAGRVAAARSLPFRALTVEPYLFDRLSLVLSCVEGFQDLTQCRQTTVANLLAAEADVVIAAHWGDVWLDDMGLSGRESPGEAEIVDQALAKITKRGGGWLTEKLVRPRLGENPDGILRAFVARELGRVGDIEDPDFRVKAFKTEQWSFRWTLASLRMFQAGAFPRLPFYDTRLADFFATVPTEFVAGRRLQLEYLKRFAPDLARIPWQAYDTNLFWYPYFTTWLLPKRAVKKGMRLLTRKRFIERNWEVQFLSEQGRQGLERWLLRPGLRLHEFISPHAVETLLGDFFAAPLREGRGYTVSMLLTFSSWLEAYG